MAEKRHPGITMHKLSFGGGFMGLLFAGGSALIFVLGFPTLWYFVLFSFGLGIGVAVLLAVIGGGSSRRNKPLSILASQGTGPGKTRGRVRWRTSFKAVPGLTSA